MPNEHIEQNDPVSSQPDAATTPIDLAQAFKMLNQANRETAEEHVETTGDGGSGEPESNAPDAPEEQQVETGEGEGAVAVDDDEQSGDGGSGGPSDFIEPIDFDSRRQEILRGLQQQALSKVRQDFTNNGITPCSIEDLYQRDENTGRVTFKNPDDPTHDFASRAEAQQWVEAFNKQIESRFRQEVNKAQQELMNQNAPTLRLIAFAPKFNSMSKIEQEIMDDLIEGYAVKDNHGQVVGYNVNLDSAAAQAKRIAKRYQQQAPASKQSGQTAAKDNGSSGPALDMPTGTGKSADEAEPKNIGEALKMIDKQNRKGK